MGPCQQLICLVGLLAFLSQPAAKWIHAHMVAMMCLELEAGAVKAPSATAHKETQCSCVGCLVLAFSNTAWL